MAIYDTREFVRKLTESGMPALQAETLADEHLKLLEEHLATKADLTLLGSELRGEMAQLRTELLGEMKALGWRLEWRLTVRLGAMMAAMVAALAAVVKLL